MTSPFREKKSLSRSSVAYLGRFFTHIRDIVVYRGAAGSGETSGGRGGLGGRMGAGKEDWTSVVARDGGGEDLYV